MSRKADQARTFAFEALKTRVKQGGNLNPETLAQSYGLPVADVERVIRSNSNA